MEKERNEVRKNALSIFKMSIFVVVCIVAAFNSYRMILLQSEIQEVNEKWKRSDPFRTMTEVKRLTDILEKGYPAEILERLGKMEEDLKRCELVELKKHMDKFHEIMHRFPRSVQGDSSGETELNNRRRQNISHSKNHGNKDFLASESPVIESGPPINTISPENRATKKSQGKVRTSKIMHFDNDDGPVQHVVKSTALKSLDTGSYASSEFNSENSEPEFAIVRDEEFSNRRGRPRMQTLDERHPRTGRIKPLPSIHLSGDTSRYQFGIHQNFNGNGHLRHLHRIFVDWKPNKWVEKTRMMNHFGFDEGYLTIKEAGLYFIYAQIFYLDVSDSNGYKVFKNDEPILQCTVQLHSGTRSAKGNTCYTAAVEYIAEGDKISLGDILEGRYSIFKPGMSFFGAIKLGDLPASM